MAIPKKALQAVLEAVQEGHETPLERLLVRPASPGEFAVQAYFANEQWPDGQIVQVPEADARNSE